MNKFIFGDNSIGEPLDSRYEQYCLKCGGLYAGGGNGTIAYPAVNGDILSSCNYCHRPYSGAVSLLRRFFIVAMLGFTIGVTAGYFRIYDKVVAVVVATDSALSRLGKTTPAEIIELFKGKHE